MTLVLAKKEKINNKNEEIPKEIDYNLESDELESSVDINSNDLLKSALENRMATSKKQMVISTIYINPFEKEPVELTLTLLPDYESGYNTVVFGAKAHFTKSMLYDLHSKWNLLTEPCKSLADKTLIEIAKLKKEIEERQEKIKELDPKQLSMLPEIERPEEETWLDATIVNLRLYNEVSGNTEVLKIFVKAKSDLTTFIISFNGKNYFTEYDILMIYTKFDNLMNKYLD